MAKRNHYPCGRFAPSGFALASRSLRLRAFRAHENFRKKKEVYVSQSTQNALKRVKVQKKFFIPFDPLRASRSAKFTKIFEKNKCVSIDSKYSETHRNAIKNFYPFDPLRALRVAQTPSGEAQPYLPHVTRRVPRSVHAKFHANWTKTVGARGIQTNKQTNRQTDKQTELL